MKIKWNSEQIPNLNIKKNEGVTFLTGVSYMRFYPIW